MNEKQFEIRDKSGDRHYFTIIPNYILNHSTGDEQALYLQMKRFAGEEGECFATQKVLAEKLSWGDDKRPNREKVRENIKKLLKRRWIKKVGTTPSRTHPIDVYEIVDLWQLNGEYYKKKKGRKNSLFSKETKRRDGKSFLSRDGKSVLEEEHSIKKNPIVSKADEPFLFKTYLTNLIGNDRRDLHIIGLYWQNKAFNFSNQLQCNSAIKRELRPAKVLIGYPDDKIVAVMKYLSKNADFKWVLETVHKYIDEDLRSLEKKDQVPIAFKSFSKEYLI